MKTKFALLALATATLVGFSTSLTAIPSNAVSVNPPVTCTDGTCYTTFDYSGDNYVWTPPSGINSLHFDVYGAQGGRTGGKGGSVSGDFATIPASLYVFVGGAGTSANAAPGGFNGGGVSGNGHGDQGSGGGASDLRTSTNLSDRVVVAGGGGGTGGWIGGAGAPGGLTIAATGTKGSPSGTAGGGGTQLAGGAAGLGVTTGNGTAGTLGLGGAGGSGTVAGGGGGGGGFYGGGGGGSDSVSGGSDGAGGGGGSSFATMALTSNVTHTAGVRSGNGQVVLRYTFAPQVSYFAASSTLSTNGTATYGLAFDQYIYSLDSTDIIFAGTSSNCYVSSITGDGYQFLVNIAGCSNGTVNLSLRPNSVLGATAGPAYQSYATNTVTMDSTSPNLILSSPVTPSNLTALKYQVTSDEQFTRPSLSAFRVFGAGCQANSISMINSFTAELTVTGCTSTATAHVVLLHNQIADLAGNLGPVTDLNSDDVLVDLDAPQVVSITPTTTGDTIDYSVTFSETVTGLSPDAFTITGTGCTYSKFEGSGANYQYWVTGCTGSSSLTVKNRTAHDLAGNAGPTADQINSGSGDTTAPTAQFTELARADKTASPSFELRFDELVSGLTINSLSRLGTARNCSFNLIELNAGVSYRIDSSNCDAGSLKLRLLPNSVSDSHGNLGPVAAIDSPNARIATTYSPNVVQVASITAKPTQKQEALVQTPTKLLKAPKPKTAINKKALGTHKTNYSFSSDSWVSLATAAMALVIAFRPTGRRRATRK